MRLRDDDVALPSLRGDDDELRDDELPDVVA